MTANGVDAAMPGFDGTNRTSSLWPMPIAIPAAKAIGNERNPATSAAAIAARTRFVIVAT